MNNKKSEKYQLLLESAKTLFADKGYHQTKIKDITDNASLGAGTFYLYFKNKDELLEALLLKYMEQMFHDIMNIYSSDKPADIKLEEIILVHVQFICTNKDFFKIYIEQAHCSGNINPIKSHINLKKKFFELVEILIKEGQENNIFSKKINIKVLSRSLLGMIGFTVVNLLVIEDDKNIKASEIADNISLVFIKGMKKDD